MAGRSVGQRSTGSGGHGISAVAWITGEDVDCVSARRAGEGTTCLRVLTANGPPINGPLHSLRRCHLLRVWVLGLEHTVYAHHAYKPRPNIFYLSRRWLVFFPGPPLFVGRCLWRLVFFSWAAAVSWAAPPAACFPSFRCLSASFSRSLFFFTLRAFLSLKACTEMNRLSQGPTGWLLLSAASALALCRCLLR